MKRELRAAGAGHSSRATVSRDSEAIMEQAVDNFYAMQEIREVVSFWQSFGANNAGVRQMCKNITRILNGEPPDPDAATMDTDR